MCMRAHAREDARVHARVGWGCSPEREGALLRACRRAMRLLLTVGLGGRTAGGAVLNQCLHTPSRVSCGRLVH